MKSFESCIIPRDLFGTFLKKEFIRRCVRRLLGLLFVLLFNFTKNSAINTDCRWFGILKNIRARGLILTVFHFIF